MLLCCKVLQPTTWNSRGVWPASDLHNHNFKLIFWLENRVIIWLSCFKESSVFDNSAKVNLAIQSEKVMLLCFRLILWLKVRSFSLLFFFLPVLYYFNLFFICFFLFLLCFFVGVSAAQRRELAFFMCLCSNVRNLSLGRNPFYLHGVQRLSILQPAVRGFWFATGLAFPHQSLINGLLYILRLFSKVRCSWKVKIHTHTYINIYIFF